jgi:hypothetical protein
VAADPTERPGRKPVRGLDEFIVEDVMVMAQSEHFIARLRRNAGDRDSIRRAKAENELVAATEHLEQLRVDYAAGDLSRDDWLDLRPRVEARLAAARDALGRLAAAKRALPEQLDRPEELPGRWANMTVGERRAVITAMIKHIEIGPAFVDRRRLGPDERAKIVYR